MEGGGGGSEHSDPLNPEKLPRSIHPAEEEEDLGWYTHWLSSRGRRITEQVMEIVVDLHLRWDGYGSFVQMVFFIPCL